MKVVAENDNNDIFAGGDNLIGLLTGLQAVLQACESAVEAQRGEMQYNISRGVPTRDTIWVGVPNQQRFQSYALTALKSVPGVVSITQFNTEILDGVLSYEAIIVTEFGPGTIGNSV